MKLLISILLIGIFSAADGSCRRGCDTALGSYYIWPGSNLTFISQITQIEIPDILSYNPQIPNQYSLMVGTRINVPFRCECLNSSEFLGHYFSFNTFPGDTYDTIAGTYYSNLTTVQWMQRFNNFPATRIVNTGVRLNVPVNCSCGDSAVSRDYGLFVTYPLREGETLESVATAANLSADLVQRYNPGVNFSSGSGFVYIPGRDRSGGFPPLNGSKGLSSGAIAGTSGAGIVGVLLLAGCLLKLMLMK